MTANSPSVATGSHVAVIGAGVIGVCSALYLQRAGFCVTVIDKDDVAGAREAWPWR